MKNILLVFTGGTIGSQSVAGTIDTDAGAGFRLIDLFQQRYPAAAQIRFKTVAPLQILSENSHPNAWQQIIAAVEAEQPERYDGIVVTHGTDTLAFAAAALGLYFHKLKRPMLLVSSDLPLEHPEANGVPNLICAADYILQQREAGVFVPYRNPGRGMQLHIATRLSNCLPLSSDFISVQSKAYADYYAGEFTFHQPPPKTAAADFQLQNRFARVMLVSPYPGMNYANLDLRETDAVLHGLYHSGTACASRQWGEQYGLAQLAQRCRANGVPLYLAPAAKTADSYASTQQLLACGAKMIWNTSLESAYAKLALAFGSFPDLAAVDGFLAQNIAGEQI